MAGKGSAKAAGATPSDEGKGGPGGTPTSLVRVQVLDGRRFGNLGNKGIRASGAAGCFFEVHPEDVPALDEDFNAGICRIVTDEEYDRMRGI